MELTAAQLPKYNEVDVKLLADVGSFPWVRVGGSYATYTGCGIDLFDHYERPLGYVAVIGKLCHGPDRRRFHNRVLHLGGLDFEPGCRYVARGDAPIEAVFPGSIKLNVPAIPVYPVHQTLAAWAAKGIRLMRQWHDGEMRLAFDDRLPDIRDYETMVRATLADMSETDIKKVWLWVTSYWRAPQHVRHRWEAQNLKAKAVT